MLDKLARLVQGRTSSMLEDPKDFDLLAVDGVELEAGLVRAEPGLVQDEELDHGEHLGPWVLKCTQN